MDQFHGGCKGRERGISLKPFYDEGKYRCRITAQALGKAKTGTPQFILKFLVLGVSLGEQEYDQTTQYERTMYRAITEKTIEYVKEDLQAIGFNRESFKYLDPNQNDFQDFTGAELTMYCSHENDQNGDMRERWGIDRGARGLKVDPLEPKGMRELDALFGKHLKGLKPATPPARNAAEQPGSLAVAGITDDDVPF
jgi:hypothetical protein